MTMPEVLTERLGGSPLAAALLAGRHGDWFDAIPTHPEQWRQRADAVRQRFSGGVPAEIFAALGGIERAPDRVRRAIADGIVVTTGQQPGLFGGPLYTWHKALTALALADTLEKAIGLPVAPIFWAATDDTDWRECASTYVSTPGGVRKLTLSGPASDGIPLADVRLGDVQPLLEAMAAGAGSALHGEYLEYARKAYRSDTTIGGAYVTLLREVLEPLGIGVLDVMHPAMRQAMYPFCRSVLWRSAEVAEALERRVAAISGAGFAAQVATVDGLSLVFHREEGAKRRVPIAEAQSIASSAKAGTFSGNVLLRPIVERQLLPTVAYVAGPAEIAYFAQVSAVADVLDVPRPLAVPRWSGMIIEPHIKRLLERHEFTLQQLREPHAAERHIADAALPAEARAALEAWREAMKDRAAAMREVAQQTGAVAPPVVDGTERAIGHRFDRLERRLRAAAKRRAVDAMQALDTVRGALFPDGKRQERALNGIPLFARHGPALLEAIQREAAAHTQTLVSRAVTAPAP